MLILDWAARNLLLAIPGAVIIVAAAIGIAWRVHVARARRRMEEEQRQAANARDLSIMLAMTPTQFEHTIAALLSRLGYQDVNRVGGTGDKGADVLCLDASGRRVIVQCKRYAPGNPVSSPDMQRFLGAMQIHRCEVGIFVTTSTFTKAARNIGEMHQVALVDGRVLVDLGNQAG
ncbi:restriction endonuclease [Arthrobacter sp. Hiyo1]|uniref:restriction endonuclease n=1 Tax=Arthrobacter sp. Hiyo1 TaxID=1588020 RepID=UPI00209C6864|nr:restriction endonuclease [Arthrobacter sp. Hiyo1]